MKFVFACGERIGAFLGNGVLLGWSSATSSSCRASSACSRWRITRPTPNMITLVRMCCDRFLCILSCDLLFERVPPNNGKEILMKAEYKTWFLKTSEDRVSLETDSYENTSYHVLLLLKCSCQRMLSNRALFTWKDTLFVEVQAMQAMCICAPKIWDSFIRILLAKKAFISALAGDNGAFMYLMCCIHLISLVTNCWTRMAYYTSLFFLLIFFFIQQ